MRLLADLHIHSRFSRATSRDLSFPSLHRAALEKGVSLVGTGDFTHAGWMAEIREQLACAGVFGPGGQQLAQVALRPGAVAVLAREEGGGGEQLAVRGPARERTRECRLRALLLAAVLEREREALREARVVGREVRRARQLGEGLVAPAGADQEQAEREVRLGQLGCDGERLAQRALRGVLAARAALEVGEVHPRRHEPRREAERGLVIKELKPKLVVLGGDALDAYQLGRFPPTRGHHKGFGLRDQVDCMKLHLDAIQSVAGKAQLAWTLGNHDLRLSRYIAVHAEHLLDLPMTRLEDWCPAWSLSWTVEVNPRQTGMLVIRHRHQPGMLHLQAVKAGTHYAHGHLHKLNRHTLATFNGYRYSVDCGSLADPDSDAFDYAEGAPAHAQGFALLTFKDGHLLMPELAYVQDGRAWFRGQSI